MAEIDNNAKQVYGAAISANTGGTDSEFTKGASKVIEYAMSSAVTRAYRDGNTDPEHIKKCMEKARDHAKDFLRSLEEMVYPPPPAAE